MEQLEFDFTVKTIAQGTQANGTKSGETQNDNE